MSISSIRASLLDGLSTIQGLSAYDTAPSTITPPAAFVTLKQTNPIEYDLTARNAHYTIHFEIEVLLGKAGLIEETQSNLDTYLDPTDPNSIQAMVVTLNGADWYRVARVSAIGNASYNGIQYLAARLDVDVGV